jgi:hypothetical protein
MRLEDYSCSQPRVGKKVWETQVQWKKLGRWHEPVTPAMAASIKIGRSQSRQPSQKARSYLQTNWSKKDWRYGLSSRTTDSNM